MKLSETVTDGDREGRNEHFSVFKSESENDIVFEQKVGSYAEYEPVK